METVYVIGSGHSGIACALGLLARQNTRVIMLDVGKTLEPNKLNDRLNQSLPVFQSDNLLPWEKKKAFQKHLFGSIYPYDIGDYSKNFDLHGVVMRTSFARGGLSNVWGASIMPYKKDDIKHWPIDCNEMMLYYKKILNHMPLSTCLQDDFCQWPLLHDNPKNYQLS